MEHSDELKEKIREILLSPSHKDPVMKILKCTVCGLILADHPEKECPEEESRYELVKENEVSIARYIMGVFD